MIKKLSFCLILVSSIIKAQTQLVFVYFTDKPNKAAFYANPLSELSQKSLDRRTTLGIQLNDQDAPIEPTYLQNLTNLGFNVVDYSKWLNGVALQATPAQVAVLQSQPYVQSVQSFARNAGNSSTGVPQPKNLVLNNTNNTNQIIYNYGQALSQIEQVNLKPLHLSNFTGNGVTIAVIDTGFPTVDTGSAFAYIRNNNKIKGGYNFVLKSNDIYNASLNPHGAAVLGDIGGFIQDTFVGSAIDADFYLYCSEKSPEEIPEEEMYWIEAAEEADRKGVDIISTSLGYYYFDDPQYNYSYSDMNGSTSFIARAAGIAVDKGIFVIAANGNSGNAPWHYLLTPADNEKVFSIGAVDASGNPGIFSSYGPNSAGIIKPDASAKGVAATTVLDGSTLTGDGTSLSAPIAAGGVACLIQAFPTMSRSLMRDKLRQTASLYPNHDNQMGYGILNFGSFLQQNTLATTENYVQSQIQIFPNPTKNFINIKSQDKIEFSEIYDNLGRLILKNKSEDLISIESLLKGTYYLKIKTKNGQTFHKIVKE